MKMKRIYGIIAIIAIIGLALAACAPSGAGGGGGGGVIVDDKPGATPPTSPPPTLSGDADIYLVGSHSGMACYWKNGSLTYLSDTSRIAEITGGNEAYGIAVSGSDIYAAGFYRSKLSNKDTACYWKNGKMIDLFVPGSGEARATGVAVSGNSVYFSGYYTSGGSRKACYWTGEMSPPIDLQAPSGGNSPWTEAVAVSGNDFYVLGYYSSNGNGAYNGVYWKNGTTIVGLSSELEMDRGLFEPYQANGITVSGNSVYIAGEYKVIDESFIQKNMACYWKDGIRKELSVPSGSKLSYANGISIFGSSVYVLGGYQDDRGSTTMCYWKDGARVNLPADFFGVRGITVVNNTGGGTSTPTPTPSGSADIYLVGSHSGTACYWKNGSLTYLSDTSRIAEITGGNEAYGIAVSGSDIYAAGFYRSKLSNKDTACYWKNGKMIDLFVPAGSGEARATGVAVSGNFVIFSGYYTSGGSRKACYWTGEMSPPIDLQAPSGGGTWAEAVAVSGNDFYVLGSYNSNGNGAYNGVYWKNGTTIVGLSGFGETGSLYGDLYQASGITVSGNSVYIAGEYRVIDESFIQKNMACYWKDGIRKELSVPSGSKLSYANGISMFGSSVYVLGGYQGNNNGYIDARCYWENGTRVDLSADFFGVCGITVAAK